MMNYFFGRKLSAQVLFHNPSMEKHSNTLNFFGFVMLLWLFLKIIIRKICSSLLIVTIHRAKLSLYPVFRVFSKLFFALRAFNKNLFTFVSKCGRAMVRAKLSFSAWFNSIISRSIAGLQTAIRTNVHKTPNLVSYCTSNNRILTDKMVGVSYG